jgi:hypothetical protein
MVKGKWKIQANFEKKKLKEECDSIMVNQE